MAKLSFQISEEIRKLVAETAQKMGVSQSDVVRIAVNEKLYRLGVLSSSGNSALSPAKTGGA